MNRKVTLIGAGAMGNAIGTRLMEARHSLSVYDLDGEKVDALAKTGAMRHASAASAASGAEFVFLSLNAAHIVRAAVFARDGVAADAKPGTTIIDMSSIDPRSTKDLAAEAMTLGLRWLDCPLSGGAPKALLGQLTVVAGGNPEDFEHARPIMQDLCSNFTHMGPSGAGQTTKLINQVLCGLNFAAVAEATRLALDAGVAAEKIPGALAGGRADSAILQEFMPRMAEGDFAVTGRISNMVKDLNGVQDLARETGTSMPLTAVCAEIHRLMTRAGFGGSDQSALMKYFDGPTTVGMKTDEI